MREIGGAWKFGKPTSRKRLLVASAARSGTVRSVIGLWIAGGRSGARDPENAHLIAGDQHAKPGDPGAKTPEAALIAKADAEQIRAAIAALPPPFRETLVLRDIEGLDYREIADATDVPIGTVMSRLARARGRLITTIGGKGQ
jgi:RNA polymerase sigma factor (sigma-70 family)